MYASGVASSFHGHIASPRNPVINPPVRKLISRGYRFEKSFDGDTTFAPIFTFSVATSTAISATNATTG